MQVWRCEAVTGDDDKLCKAVDSKPSRMKPEQIDFPDPWAVREWVYCRAVNEYYKLKYIFD